MLMRMPISRTRAVTEYPSMLTMPSAANSNDHNAALVDTPATSRC